MHKVEQEVSAALAKYQEQRLRAGAPNVVYAQRAAVRVVIEQRVSPAELEDYLISKASRAAPVAVEDEAEEAPKPRRRKKADVEAEAEEVA